MNLATPGTLALLCDPVGYYRPWRRSRDAMSATQRAGLNDFLVKHYALPGWSAAPASDALLTSKLVSVWSRLDDVALLVACGKQARWIVGQRRAASLPPGAHQFIRMGFGDDDGGSAPRPAGVDEESLVAWGGAYLQHLASRLPSWMAARLPLSFMGLGAGALPRNPNPDMTCLWMAINHASQHSIFRMRLSH